MLLALGTGSMLVIVDTIANPNRYRYRYIQNKESATLGHPYKKATR